MDTENVKELTPELFSKPFKASALNILVDKSEDDAIYCFRAHQPHEKDFSMLKDQLPGLYEPKINSFAGTEGPQDEEELPPVIKDEDNDIDKEF